MSVMDKIKARTAELKDKKQIDIPNYVSIIDYDKCGIIELETRDKLINCEKKAVHHANEISKNTMELSKIFGEAQNLLANHNGGTFKIWFESLGFKKDFVYMCLKRNNLYLELKEEKVFSIPDRAIKSISKIKDQVDSEKILEIVNSKKPSEVAKETEKELSVRPTTEIEEAILVNEENKSQFKIENYKFLAPEVSSVIEGLDEKKRLELEKHLDKINKILN